MAVCLQIDGARPFASPPMIGLSVHYASLDRCVQLIHPILVLTHALHAYMMDTQHFALAPSLHSEWINGQTNISSYTKVFPKIVQNGPGS